MAKPVRNWKITTNRFVTYIDIMGFKDMVARLSNKSIYVMMKNIHNTQKLIESIDWVNSNIGDISITSYSDSIMMYSKDDSYSSFAAIEAGTSALTEQLFQEGIPHKGAMAYGIMTLDKRRSIFFGQPLIDAFLLQQEMNLYGIILHSSAEMKTKSFKEGEDAIYLINFPCPFKNGTANHYGIGPLGAYGDAKKMDEIIEKIGNMRNMTSGVLRKYIENTEAFLSIVRDETINDIDETIKKS